MNTDLPPTVPALKPEQICAMRANGDGGTHCLIGWASAAFGGNWERAKRLLCSTGSIPGGCVAHWNDTHSPEERVALWSRMVESLGYVRRGDVFVRPEAAQET